MNITTHLTHTLKLTTACAVTLIASGGISYADNPTADVKLPSLDCNSIDASRFTGVNVQSTLDKSASPMKATEDTTAMLSYNPPAGLNCRQNILVSHGTLTNGFVATATKESLGQASGSGSYWHTAAASVQTPPSGSQSLIGTLKRMGPKPAINVVAVTEGAVYNIDPLTFSPSGNDQTIVTNTFTIADGED